MLRRYEKSRRRNLLAKPGIHELIMVLDRLKSGFNVPRIFRGAEAFGMHEIHLINTGPFNPAPAKGAFGRMESLKVSIAASIAMYEYVRQGAGI